MKALPFVVVGALALGCGSILGITDVPEPSDGGSKHDAGDAGKDVVFDIVSDTVTPDGDGAACGVDPNACNDTSVVPSGWTPLVFASPSSTCPAGFAGETKVETEPTTQAGACDCQATQTSPPGCTTGSLPTKIGASCNASAETFVVTGPGCIGGFGTPSIASMRLASPLPASGGSCTGQAVPDPSKLTTSAATLCTPSSCPEQICAGQAPTGFQACISHDGDVACPAGSPFATKHAVADSFTLDCDCSSCTATASCGAATLTFYSDGSCNTLLSTLAVDGACHATGAPSPADAFASVKYAATVSNPSYSAGPKTPIIGGQNSRTVCCR